MCLPFGLKIGNPSKPLKKVILSRSEPSLFIDYRSKSLPFGSCKLEEKTILLPIGKKYGPKFAAPLFVICFLFVPSEFMVQICRAIGRIEF